MPKVAILDEAAISAERLRSMANVFARADRVLSGQDIRCNVVHLSNISAPAWSDGRDITFNADQIGSITSIDDIIKVTGVNYHELSHIFFTPRQDTWIVSRMKEENLFAYFNMLEDQRIETLMVAKYPSTKPFFVAMFMRYLLSHREQWDTVFALAHGRKYLPLDARQQMQARFIKQSLVSDLARVIDAYRQIAFPRDNKEALLLIREYAALMAKMPKQPSADPNGHTQSGRQDIPSKGSMQGDQEKTARKAKNDKEAGPSTEQGKDEKTSGKSKDNDTEDDEDAASNGEGDEDSDGDDDTDDDDGDYGDGEEGADDEDGEDGSGSGDSDDGDDEDVDDAPHGKKGGSKKAGSKSGDDGDADGEDGEGDGDAEGGTPGTGVGKGGFSDTPSVVSDDDFADILDNIAQQAEQAPEVQADARGKQEVIINGDGDTMSVLNKHEFSDRSVPDSILGVARNFGKTLRNLRDDMDPGWNREQSSGRLNVGRAMRGDDLTTVFDRWDEGRNEAADIEAVILLDFSGSMIHVMEDACQAMWAIKRGFEDIGGKVTVIGYSTAATLMYNSGEKVGRTKYRSFGVSGGTEPRKALHEALRLLHKSRRKSKFLISISDGDWGSGGRAAHGGDETPSEYEQMIQRCNAAGVVTGMFYIAGGAGAGDRLDQNDIDSIKSGIRWQGHTVRQLSFGAADLPSLAMGIVKARLKQPVR